MKFVYLSILTLCILCAPPALALTFETPAKSLIIVDYDTGAVLYDKEADMRIPTASMSKVMTMYVVFDALKSGKISMTDTLPVSEKAWRMQGSKMFVGIGDNIKVEDLVRGVIVQSGNDATIVLAEGLAGTEEAFAKAMNEKAKSLGMNASNFTNASGWPDPNHYSTARDLAVLGSAIIRDFPEYYPIYSEKEFAYHSDKPQGNRNPLLYRNIGGDGIKTGHTEEAGYGLIGSGIENGRRVVFVVSGLADQEQRAEESAKILLWGLRSFENKKLIAADTPIESAPVVFGLQKKVSLVLPNDIIMTVPKLKDDATKMQIKYKAPLIAPVKKGDPVGVLTLQTTSGSPMEYPLIAGEDVPELTFFPKILAKFNYRIGLH